MNRKTLIHPLDCHAGERRYPIILGGNSREAYCPGWDCANGLGSMVGYGVAPNPPYKTIKVIE